MFDFVSTLMHQPACEQYVYKLRRPFIWDDERRAIATDYVLVSAARDVSILKDGSGPSETIIVPCYLNGEVPPRGWAYPLIQLTGSFDVDLALLYLQDRLSS